MKLLKYCLILLAVMVLTVSTAQDINDLKSINVDQLSDAQVQQFLDKAKESGMTLEQLELVAQQRGMSSTQISKLRSRIRALQLGATTSGGQIESASNRLRESADETDYSFFEAITPKKESSSDELRVFGSEIFASASTFESSQNLPTPENYVLGPGDEIIIDVYGASEITYQQMISPDGYIIVSGVGPISLAGIDIQVAKNRIFNKLSTIYSGLKGGNPNTYLQISIGKVRSVKVNVVGNVTQPGTYTLSSFSTIFNALYNAGGPAKNGSMRNVELIRAGKKVAVLDVYQYLFDGDNSQNLQLQEGDVIVVKPYEKRVKLAGAVKNPAIYELQDNESLDNLIQIAGGFDEGAFKESLTIDRIGEREKKVVTIKRENFKGEFPQNGDDINVSRILNTYENRVKINGAVKRPGYYELTNELTLSGLISQSDGLRRDAYLQRGNIIRLADDLSLKNISFDIKSVIDGNQDIILSPDDLIIIPSIFDIEEKEIVSINGQIRKPGSFPFVENMTVEDLIGLSGGLKEDASSTTIEVARRLSNDEDLSKSSEIFTFRVNGDLSIDEDASQFQLKPFDLVLIKSTPYVREHKVIRIEGEVNFPGMYALKTHEDKLSDLIKRAGGLTEFGYPDGAILIRKTEYFQSGAEKRAIAGLVEKRRRELESKYAGNENSYEFIEQQLAEYEKELTENLKKDNANTELEARIFRTQQLRKLLSRDSVGGFNDVVEQEAIGIELNRAISSPGSEYDLILRDGDLISVPKKLETVRVQGEVLYPNTVRFNEGTSFRSYISASGGFSSQAKIGKSYVVYANGSAKRTKSFLFFRKFPPIKPGTDIIIPQREVRRRLSVQEVLGITSSLATIALIIDRLSN